MMTTMTPTNDKDYDPHDDDADDPELTDLRATQARNIGPNVPGTGRNTQSKWLPRKKSTGQGIEPGIAEAQNVVTGQNASRARGGGPASVTGKNIQSPDSGGPKERYWETQSGYALAGASASDIRETTSRADPEGRNRG